MLSIHCLHNGHDICNLWPLCDCDCHPEKKLEQDILSGKITAQQVYDRMEHRIYCRSYAELRNTQRRAEYRRKRAQCTFPGCTKTYVVGGKPVRYKMCIGHARAMSQQKRRQLISSGKLGTR